MQAVMGNIGADGMNTKSNDIMEVLKYLVDSEDSESESSLPASVTSSSTKLGFSQP